MAASSKILKTGLNIREYKELLVFGVAFGGKNVCRIFEKILMLCFEQHFNF
jgi:hypothetical protein